LDSFALEPSKAGDLGACSHEMNQHEIPIFYAEYICPLFVLTCFIFLFPAQQATCHNAQYTCINAFAFSLQLVASHGPLPIAQDKTAVCNHGNSDREQDPERESAEVGRGRRRGRGEEKVSRARSSSFSPSHSNLHHRLHFRFTVHRVCHNILLCPP
jgi:hypothetical protein